MAEWISASSGNQTQDCWKLDQQASGEHIDLVGLLTRTVNDILETSFGPSVSNFMGLSLAWIQKTEKGQLFQREGSVRDIYKKTQYHDCQHPARRGSKGAICI